MAKIDVRKIKKIVKDRNTVQDEVSATYTVFEKFGEKSTNYEKGDDKYVVVASYDYTF